MQICDLKLWNILRGFFWWKNCGGKLLVEKWWKIFGASFLVKKIVENFWSKIFGGQYSVEKVGGKYSENWEGTS